MINRKRVRPGAIAGTMTLVVAAIIANQTWLWVVTVLWLFLAVYALLMYVSGKA